MHVTTLDQTLGPTPQVVASHSEFFPGRTCNRLLDPPVWKDFHTRDLLLNHPSDQQHLTIFENSTSQRWLLASESIAPDIQNHRTSFQEESPTFSISKTAETRGQR